MTKKGRRPKEICRTCWDNGEEYGKLKCSQNLDYCPFNKLPKEKKKYRWNCEMCGKGTNRSTCLVPETTQGWNYGETALCLKHFKEWLEIRGKYCELAFQEFMKKKITN